MRFNVGKLNEESIYFVVTRVVLHRQMSNRKNRHKYRINAAIQNSFTAAVGND